MSESVPGTVYLLHFHGGGIRQDANRVARHYLGWTEGDPRVRMATHVKGRGSGLVKAAIASGLTVEIARTWEGKDRHFERWLKRKKKAPSLCPICNPRAMNRARD